MLDVITMNPSRPPSRRQSFQQALEGCERRPPVGPSRSRTQRDNDSGHLQELDREPTWPGVGRQRHLLVSLKRLITPARHADTLVGEGALGMRQECGIIRWTIFEGARHNDRGPDTAEG